jgi:hypothetical protein
LVCSVVSWPPESPGSVYLVGVAASLQFVLSLL